MFEVNTQQERDELSEKSVYDKLELGKKVVRQALDKYARPVVAFTGGKDSTLTAYLVKEVCEEEGIDKPPFMFVDHGQHFEEVEDFVQRIGDQWGFEVIRVRNDDLIDKAEEPGDTVPVSELNETNRKEVARLEGDYDEVPWLMNTEAGNHLLKTVPMLGLIREKGIDAVVVGIRWDEQEARSTETFFSERKDPDHMRVHPILPFRERDVWKAIWLNIVPDTVEGWSGKKVPREPKDLPEGVDLQDLPVASPYWEGFRSLGSKVSTKKVSDDPAWTQDLQGTVEREGRAQDKEKLMKQLRKLGYM